MTIDLDALDRLHAAASTVGSPLLERQAAVYELHNAWPAVSEELRALREVATRHGELAGAMREVYDALEALTCDGSYGYEAMLSQRARLRAALAKVPR